MAFSGPAPHKSASHRTGSRSWRSGGAHFTRCSRTMRTRQWCSQRSTTHVTLTCLSGSSTCWMTLTRRGACSSSTHSTCSTCSVSGPCRVCAPKGWAAVWCWWRPPWRCAKRSISTASGRFPWTPLASSSPTTTMTMSNHGRAFMPCPTRFSISCTCTRAGLSVCTQGSARDFQV